MKLRKLTAVALAVSAFGSVPARRAPAETPRLPGVVRPEALMAHIRFLADDLLEGRGAGTRGYDLAALYVAAQFEALGLAPGGTGGSYFQQVPLRAATLVSEDAHVEWRRGAQVETLEHGRDFVLNANFNEAEADVTAPLVFVGHGVYAPELKHDDFAGVDVSGKIVALLFGAPRHFDNDQRAHFGRPSNKLRDLARRGAVGAVLLRQPRAERIFRWQRVVEGSRLPSMRWLDAEGRPNDAPPQVRAGAGLSVEATERLLAAAGHALPDVLKAIDEQRFRPFDLGVEVRIRTRTRHRDLASPNVAALLRGTDLAGETLVLTAHLDHVGIDEGREGDGIYNGAYDNASGVAALIEVARLFAAGPRPRRSVLFLAVTAEERGLLGSDYYAHHPTVPDIVANVNMDEVFMLAPIADLVAYGAEHSSLGGTVEKAARAVGLEVTPDPWPEQSIFVRSDHYSFVRQGVPAVYLWPNFRAAGEEGDKAAASEWLANVYHTPADDLGQTFDTRSAVRFVQALYLAGLDVADADARPQWNAGDFFGETFGRREQGVPAAPTAGAR